MSPARREPITGVRYSYETGLFEGRCFDCGRFYPLDREFWYVRSLRQCRACIDVQRRLANELRLAKVRDDPKAEARRVYQREWKRRHKMTIEQRGSYLRGVSPNLRDDLQRRRNRRRMRIVRIA